MRRPGFGFVGLALCIVIVFAPRPPSGEAPPTRGAEGKLIAGRVLAPAVDAATLRERGHPRSLRESISPHWLAVLVGALALGLRRWIFNPNESLSYRRVVAFVGARGSRAPPPIPA
jgi:hypothetical protein